MKDYLYVYIYGTECIKWIPDGRTNRSQEGTQPY